MSWRPELLCVLGIMGLAGCEPSVGEGRVAEATLRTEPEDATMSADLIAGRLVFAGERGGRRGIRWQARRAQIALLEAVPSVEGVMRWSEAVRSVIRRAVTDDLKAWLYSPPRATIRVGRPIVIGAMDRRLVQRSVQRREADFLDCWRSCGEAVEAAASRARCPAAGGRADLGFVISAGGWVEKAKVVYASVDHPALDACLLGVLRSIRFPWSNRGGIHIVQRQPLYFGAR